MSATPTGFAAGDFEKLGEFYLGRKHDLASGATGNEVILYDARDLTTHAVCVGMTGSGKTGLCTCLLEEALLDGVPAIAVDVKGDLSNLLLAFPELRPADFAPWVDPAEATRQGLTPEEFAAQTAGQWRDGLAAWGQDGSRIGRLKDACEMRIFTPGSDAGLPLSILKSFDAPPQQSLEDKDALRERLVCVVGGLLGLLGIDADPLKSREHILLSTILRQAWDSGAGTSLPGLIQSIQTPPFDRVGVFELDVFFPPKDRLELAMALNNLLASPTFAAWLEGEPLDVNTLLWSPGGKPRLSILYIAHLSEQERVFFVSLLLNEVLSWVRAQSGTSSLRAILYMDEIFGYFPPIANPPTKQPMLSLLKQARAFGLGVVLATQNPVDLDYKGLANTGTWLIGRLQTERDKARLLEGLEGASMTAGASFDRGQMEQTLAGLGKRVFLLHNVHEDRPVIFSTRWAMSYLRGPLTRDQVRTLMAPQLAARPSTDKPPLQSELPPPQQAQTAPGPGIPATGTATPPAAIRQLYFHQPAAAATPVTYSPALYARSRLHFADARLAIDEWRTVELLSTALGTDDPWATVRSPAGLQSADAPLPAAQFGALPLAAGNAKSYETWRKMLVSRLYSEHKLEALKCPALKLASEPGESGAAFAARVAQTARELRDAEVDKLRQKFAAKQQQLQARISAAQERVQREQGEYSQQKLQSAVDIGTTVLGALLGRKALSSRTIDRARSSARKVGRAGRERGDVAKAQEDLTAAQTDLAALDAQLRRELEELRFKHDPARLELKQHFVAPRKSEIEVELPCLAWVQQA